MWAQVLILNLNGGALILNLNGAYPQQKLFALQLHQNWFLELLDLPSTCCSNSWWRSWFKQLRVVLFGFQQNLVSQLDFHQHKALLPSQTSEAPLRLSYWNWTQTVKHMNHIPKLSAQLLT